MTQTDSLARAIDYLGAVEVAPGLYAYKPANHNRWYTENAGDLMVHLQGRRTPSRTMMPAWWTPEHRFVWRSGCQVTFDAAGPSVKQWDRGGPPWILYSADLETGTEVPT